MAYCGNCGAELRNRDLFCGDCGEKVTGPTHGVLDRRSASRYDVSLDSTSQVHMPANPPTQAPPRRIPWWVSVPAWLLVPGLMLWRLINRRWNGTGQHRSAMGGLALGLIALSIVAYGAPVSAAFNAVDPLPTAIPVTPEPTQAPAYYALTASGTLPHEQAVGEQFVVTVQVFNNGDYISDLVVDLSGATDHWVLDDATGPNGTASKSDVGDYYHFGPFLSEKRQTITLLMTPTDAGNHTMDIAFYNGADSTTGIPSGDPLTAITADVAIDP